MIEDQTASKCDHAARFKRKIASICNEPDYQAPADFAARVRADIARSAPIVKASGFVAD